MRSLTLVAVFLISLFCAAFASHVATVRFNSRGVKGYITFTEQENGNVRIVTNLQGLRGMHDWHVHGYPVDQSLDPSVQCTGAQVGGHYNPFGRNISDPNYPTNCQGDQSLCEVGDFESKFGPLPMNGQVDVMDTSGQLSLSGRYSIVGRTVIIHQADDVAPGHLECGVIHLNEEIEGTPVTLLQATFISPIAGTIYMRQVGLENVEIFGKLYWVNDSDSTVEHNWHIHVRQPGEEYRVGDCDITADGNVGPHYDPTGNGPTSRPGYSTDCTPDTPTGCEIGDLTGKHARIDISARPDPYRDGAFFFTDSFLNLTDVVGSSIVVHVPNGGGPALACAPLVQSENFTLTAAGAQARFIKASQSSPFEDTIIIGFGEVGDDIRPLPTNEVTVLTPALGPVSFVCSGEDVYRPYVRYEGAGAQTPDRYDLGDWRNRYSDDLVAFNSFRVFDMPVYGANSMAGRTMRTLFNETSRVCSSWIPMLSGDDILRARAVFSGSSFGPIEGVIYFFQRDYGSGIRGSTLIVMDIYYSGMNLNTTGHNWHVHQTLPEEGMTCLDSIGGHFNPFSVSLGTLDAEDAGDRSMFSDYGDDCSPTYPLRCESGDLAGKHGRLRITSDASNRPTYAFLDPDVQLTGTYSIVGRSIGLHNFTGPLFDCGGVRPLGFSANVLFVNTTASQYDRSEFNRRLTEGTGVDPTDVFIGGAQFIYPFGPESDVECVSFALRILGETQEEADNNFAAVANSGNPDEVRCVARAAAATVIVSPILLVACLLVTLFK